MGLIIIFASFIVIGIILTIISFKVNDSYNPELFDNAYGGFAVLFYALGSMGLIASGIPAICIQSTNYNEYQKYAYTRQVIEYRLENKNENIVGNEFLYKDIIEFNNTLRVHKKYCNNFFLNWFHNDELARLDYIEIDGLGGIYEK